MILAHPHANGDVKSIRKFAWFPTGLENGSIIWLEYYDQISTYHTYFERGIWPRGWWYHERYRIRIPKTKIV